MSCKHIAEALHLVAQARCRHQVKATPAQVPIFERNKTGAFTFLSMQYTDKI